MASVLGFQTNKLQAEVDISFHLPDLHLDELVLQKF